MPFTGNLLAESLRKEEALDAVPLTVRRIWRSEPEAQVDWPI
jgi:hypothetical protein